MMGVGDSSVVQVPETCRMYKPGVTMMIKTIIYLPMVIPFRFLQDTIAVLVNSIEQSLRCVSFVVFMLINYTVMIAIKMGERRCIHLPEKQSQSSVDLAGPN